jgi:hypothetical protein
MTRLLALCLCAALCTLPGCRSADRDNPVDAEADPQSGAGLSVVIPVPKALTTVVDSLVARLEGPGMVTVVKSLDYTTPLGPATLTIGAVSPGQDRVLIIEGYDHTGRLIFSGEQRGIAIIIGDTTQVNVDLRLVIDPSELEGPDPSPDDGEEQPSG